MIESLERTTIPVNASNQDNLLEASSEIFGELNVSAGIALISLGRFEEMEPGATFIQ